MAVCGPKLATIMVGARKLGPARRRPPARGQPPGVDPAVFHPADQVDAQRLRRVAVRVPLIASLILACRRARPRWTSAHARDTSASSWLAGTEPGIAARIRIDYGIAEQLQAQMPAPT
jgi:hypothetical protein